mmetsp:Transcript_59438/g.141621  ORF Transcript_59438/g.141621 Transcript_59438/m.141621 type:complete len:183 (-) Transcript_59438:164-712(-)
MALWEFGDGPEAEEEVLAISEEGSSDELEAVVVPGKKKAPSSSSSSSSRRGKKSKKGRKRSRSRKRRRTGKDDETALAIRAPLAATPAVVASAPPAPVAQVAKPTPAQGIFSLIRAPEDQKSEVAKASSGGIAADVPVSMLLAGSKNVQLPQHDMSTGGVEVCQLFRMGRCPRWQCRFKHIK